MDDTTLETSPAESESPPSPESSESTPSPTKSASSNLRGQLEQALREVADLKREVGTLREQNRELDMSHRHLVGKTAEIRLVDGLRKLGVEFSKPEYVKHAVERFETTNPEFFEEGSIYEVVDHERSMADLASYLRRDLSEILKRSAPVRQGSGAGGGSSPSIAELARTLT